MVARSTALLDFPYEHGTSARELCNAAEVVVRRARFRASSATPYAGRYRCTTRN
jgi:hypothetical protein